MSDRKATPIAANIQQAAKQVKVALAKLAVLPEGQHAVTKQLQGVLKTLIATEVEAIVLEGRGGNQ